MWTSLSVIVFFFFSSRRRHTRLQGDWSSDVCSSDLGGVVRVAFDFGRPPHMTLDEHGLRDAAHRDGAREEQRPAGYDFLGRSEERRVGKECRYRWAGGR